MNKKIILGIVAALIIGMVGIGILREVRKKKNVKKTVEIGVIVPLSGSASNLGIYSSNGLKLALEDFNKAGAIEGTEIKLIIEDSRSDTKTGIACLNKILLTNKPLLIYSQMSSVCMAIKNICIEKKIPLIAISSASALLDSSKFVYRNYFDPFRTGKSIAAYLIDTLDAKNVGVFYSNDDYGLSMRNSFVDHFKKTGKNISYESSFEIKGENFRDIIIKADLQKIDNIFLVGVGKGLGNLIKQLRQAGYKGNFIGDTALTYPEIISTAGDAYYNVYFLDYDFDASAISDFNSKYKLRFPNDNYSAVTYTSYAVLDYILKGIKKEEIRNESGLKSFLNNNSATTITKFGKMNVVDQYFEFNIKIKKYIAQK